jgi:hypothetical protein
MAGRQRNCGRRSWVSEASKSRLCWPGGARLEKHRFDESPLYLRYTSWPIASSGSLVMESDSWPLDPGSADALVVRVIDDIDESDDVRRDHLLSDLLCAAWGSILAQNQ